LLPAERSNTIVKTVSILFFCVVGEFAAQIPFICFLIQPQKETTNIEEITIESNQFRWLPSILVFLPESKGRVKGYASGLFYLGY